MDNTMVSRTISVHNEHEFLSKLERAGLNNALAQKVVDSKDNDLAAKVVRLIQNGGFEATTSQKRSREIMGENFFGVEEAIKHFGVNPTYTQLAALSEISFSEAVLEELKSTHVLAAVFSLSVLETRGKVKDKGLFYNQNWYNKQPFAKERSEASWQLIRKTPVDNSFSKNWQEQQALIAEDDEVPSAQVMVYTIIGLYLSTGEQLFKQIYVRTSSVDSDGDRVSVGCFDSVGLRVFSYWGGYRFSDLGLASSRKS
jgi:sulfur relay (sulfurtransferase) DsrF/TusC family protein